MMKNFSLSLSLPEQNQRQSDAKSIENIVNTEWRCFNQSRWHVTNDLGRPLCVAATKHEKLQKTEKCSLV